MPQFAVQHVRFFRPATHPIHCMAFDNYSSRLAVSRSDGSLELYRHHSSGVRFTFDMVLPAYLGNEDSPTSIEALAWYNGRLFSAGFSGSLIEYDLERLAIARSLSLDSSPVWSISACTSSSTGGGVLACGCDSGNIYLVNLLSSDCGPASENALELMGPPLCHGSGRVLSLAWVSDGYLAVGEIGAIHVWRTSGSRPKIGWHMALPEKVVVWSLAAYPADETLFLSSDSRGIVTIWNVKNGTMISELSTHSLDVLTLAVGKVGNSQMVFAAGADPVVVSIMPSTAANLANVDSWISSEVHRFNTHDVRASCFVAPDLLLTAGVDRQITVAKINASFINRKNERASLFTRISPVLNWSNCISVERISSSQTVLAALQSSENGEFTIEIWQLLASPQDYEVADESNKDEKREPNRQLVIKMPLRCQPQLVKMSPLANFIAFAIGSTVRVCKLDIRAPSSSKFLTLNFESSRRKIPSPMVTAVSFANEPSKMPMFVLAADGQLRVRSLWHPEMSSTFCVTEDFSSDTADAENTSLPTLFLRTAVVESSGKSETPELILVAIGSRTLIRLYGCKHQDSDNGDVFTLETICRLPTYTGGSITAMNIYPSQHVLIAFSDRRIAEFDGNSQRYTKWTRRSLNTSRSSRSKRQRLNKDENEKTNEKGAEHEKEHDIENPYPRVWLDHQESIDWIGYCSSSFSKILTVGSKVMATFDTTVPLPLRIDGPLIKPLRFTHRLPLSEDDLKRISIRQSSRFRYILAFECLKPFEDDEASANGCSNNGGGGGGDNDDEITASPGELFLAELPPAVIASQLPAVIVSKKPFAA